MRAYNYLDVNPNCHSLVIEDDGTIYEFFEPDPTILESCDDWTYMDCKNYLHNNEPFDVRESEDSENDNEF